MCNQINKKSNNLNHIAIAVNDLKEASKIWRDTLGCNVSKIKTLPKHGVKVVFVSFSNIKIELLEPLRDSPINNFLSKNPRGGLHHICIEVNDIKKAKEKVESNNIEILNNGKIQNGAHNKPVIFLNPIQTMGTLIELEEK